MRGETVKLPWYRPTPERLVMGILALEGGLLLADRYYLFGLRRGDLWNMKLAAGVIVGTIASGLVWLAIGGLLGRRCQFGIGCLLLLAVAVAIPSAWYAKWVEDDGRQRAAVAEVAKIQTRILRGTPHRQWRVQSEPVTMRPGRRCDVVGVSFAVEEDIGCGCCYSPACSGVVDDDLRRLAPLHRLERLELPDAKITDDGLVHIGKLKELRYLDLSGNAITDAGLARLRNLRKLEHLDLSRTQITDDGFVHIGALASLQWLAFSGTEVIDTGTKHLTRCQNLKHCSGWFSVAGVQALDGVQGLEELYGSITQPTPSRSSDDSLAFENHARLRILHLQNGMRLGPVRLVNLPALESASISIGACRHTIAGQPPSACTTCRREVEKLHLEDLPKLESLSAGNVQRLTLLNAPKLDSIALSGIVERGHLREIGRQAQLRRLSLNVETYTAPDVFAELGRLPALRELQITGKGLTDASLAVLEGFPALTSLSLPKHARLSGEGLAHLGHLKSLERLTIHGVRDAGEPLASLSGLSRLESLCLIDLDVGTLWLAHLPSLEEIRLFGRIGTLELVDLPALRGLDLGGSHTTVRRLVARKLPSLESLAVDRSKPDEPLERVQLEELPALRSLDLEGHTGVPRLTDDCLEHVDTFTRLWSIDLSHSRVTDRTIERLMRLPRLERVYLHSTQTTEAAAERLRQAGAGRIQVSQSGPR